MEECIEISNDTQLNYHQERLSYLIGQEVSQLFSLNDLLVTIALLLSAGAMMLAFIQTQQGANSSTLVSGINWPTVVTVLILVFVLAYAIFTHCKYTEDKKKLPIMIKETQKAIETYTTKAEK